MTYEQNPGNGNYSYLTKVFSIQADAMQNLYTPPPYNGDAGWIGSVLPSNFTNNILGDIYAFNSRMILTE